MSKTVSNKPKKESIFVLVKWTEDIENLYSIIKRCELLEPVENELEFNAVYTALYKGTKYLAEFLYCGSKPNCESLLKNVILSGKKNRKDEPKNKNSSFESNGSIASKKTVEQPCTSKDHGNHQLNSNQNKLVESYEKQLDERNDLISSLKQTVETQKKKIVEMEEKLESYRLITEDEFLSSVVRFSVQTLKHLGTQADRDEVKKYSCSTGQIVLSEKYKNVVVDEEFLMRVSVLIDQKKSNKIVFKSMITALIPDVSIWGKNNGEYMRTNFGDILNACRDYLYTKKIILTEDKYKLCLRELCNQCKKRLGEESKDSIQDLFETDE